MIYHLEKDLDQCKLYVSRLPNYFHTRFPKINRFNCRNFPISGGNSVSFIPERSSYSQPSSSAWLMRERAVCIRAEERGRRTEGGVDCVSILAEKEGNGKREK